VPSPKIYDTCNVKNNKEFKMMKSLTTACAVIAASANGVEMFGSLFGQALNGGFRGFGDDSA